MDNWKKYKLIEIINLIGGGTPKTSVKEYWNGSIPWLSVVDFNNGQKKVYDTEKKITELAVSNSSTKILRAGQIIISARGTVGVLAQLGKDMAFNQSCYGIDAKDTITTNDFLYYLIGHNINQIKSNAYGSVFDTITRSTFENIEILLPPLPEQIAISEILSSLDDKIELNLQTNKTLEEMANALYKHWFVDFGPFKNGKFLESELGLIPEGWEVNDLSAVAQITMGQSPESIYYNEAGEGLPFHQGVTDYGIRFPKDRVYSTLGNRYAFENDILFSVRAPVGKINISKHKIILGRGLAAIKHKSLQNNFLFYSLKNQFKTLDSIGSGTVYNSVNKTDIEKIKILTPTDIVIKQFNEIVIDWDIQYFNNDIETQSLKQTRDFLLPKLISGEIRVKQAAKAVKEIL